jgi:hypothetical protein
MATVNMAKTAYIMLNLIGMHLRIVILTTVGLRVCRIIPFVLMHFAPGLVRRRTSTTAKSGGVGQLFPPARHDMDVFLVGAGYRW